MHIFPADCPQAQCKKCAVQCSWAWCTIAVPWSGVLRSPCTAQESTTYCALLRGTWCKYAACRPPQPATLAHARLNASVGSHFQHACA